jgi:hypothetical protein
MSAGRTAIALVLGLMFATFPEVLAGDWRFYTKSVFGLYEYDTEESAIS